jgi:DNA replication protein DnaC
MKANDKVDAAHVDLLLSELRLSGIKLVWSALAATADKEGWPAARFLAALAEQELADRGQRRFARHLAEARRPARDRCFALAAERRVRCPLNAYERTPARNPLGVSRLATGVTKHSELGCPSGTR